MTLKSFAACFFTALAFTSAIALARDAGVFAVTQVNSSDLVAQTPNTRHSTLNTKANSKWHPKLIRTIQGFTQMVGAIAITPDGQNIVAGSDSGAIKVWNLKTGKLVRSLNKHTDAILSLAISSDGKTLVSASGLNEQAVRIWNLKTGAVIKTIQKPDWFVKSVAISPDNKQLALGIWNTATRKPQVEVLNLSTGATIYSLQGSSESNLTVNFSPHGKILASGNEDSTIQLWDMATGNLLHTLNHGAAVRAIAFSRDSKSLISESYTQTVKVWNVQTGELLSTPIADSGIVFVNAVAVRPQGDLFASALGGENGVFNIFDINTGKVISPVTGYSGVVSAVAFTPNGQTLVSGNSDGSISIWQGK